MKMGKKALLALAFVAVAVVSGLISGGMVLAFEMYQGSVEAKSTSQEAIVEIAQTENEEITQAEIEDAVQAEKMTFSCGVSGCTRTDSHTHDSNSCGVSGCTQIGEHSHGEDHESSGSNESRGGHHHSGHDSGHKSGHH